ncbi:hypothetical protein F-VV57_0101 [Faustovirus]|nr:hypothetical protein F-VV57_0101 [Faustovirus]QJX73369.1 hypothetical protein F-VV63_0103 [Faustovirus]
MDDCIFPIEILEAIAANDVFVAYVIQSTCRELQGLRVPAKPKRVCNIYGNWRFHQFVRIAYEEADGQCVDYFHLGDWTIHNYYKHKTGCRKIPDAYNRIVIYNHRLQVHDVHLVHKKRLEYRDSNDALVLSMDPKLFSKYGFDYVYRVKSTRDVKYHLLITVRPDQSRATWTYAYLQ